ncbi:hypothetical protein [Hymenobacter volaticus]|uniref:Ubiquitin-like domain-containing protein n=1 Tax=Hymenobacter volaticus TaxID=2932254 RepID=A0ABY4G3D5_9BACT|nr:hypothetical protein [Hymenobacter volaticus]UOQ65328.1 hypothetical protein MUN86_17485 [Hymenobacter volaticus]
MTRDTFSIGPSGVYTQIKQDGQFVTVVKLQDGLPNATPELRQQLMQQLNLTPDDLLLVLRSDGSEPDQGTAQDLYDQYLSTNTAAVADVTWQSIP